MNLQELRRKRAGLIQKAEHVLAIARQEERGMNEQETRDYDQFMAEIETLGNDIERLERLERAQAAAGGGEERGGEQRQTQPDDPNIGMNEREIQQYSLVRAINAAYRARRGEPNAWRGAELELEASQAVSQRLGQTPEGFFVPYDWAGRGLSQQNRERRDMSVGNPAAGGYFVAEDILSQSFIELLRNRMVVRQAGATVLTGLVGDIAIPKQTSGATAYWLGEGGAPTESTQAIGQVPMTPRTVGAFSDYTRKLLLQASIDVEAFMRNDLTAVLQLAIDLAALHGAGSANQPLGIANTTGIGAPGTGAASEALVVDLETAVAVDNADVGRLAYMTNATVRGTLKKTDIGTDTMGRVWNTMAGNTPVNGYPAWVTNQVTGTNIFFGNWADLIIGFWSGLDIMVDPYTHSTSGTVRVVALQDCDVAVRHPESFALDSTS